MTLARAIFSIREKGVDGVHWHMVGAKGFYGRRKCRVILAFWNYFYYDMKYEALVL